MCVRVRVRVCGLSSRHMGLDQATRTAWRAQTGTAKHRNFDLQGCSSKCPAQGFMTREHTMTQRNALNNIDAILMFLQHTKLDHRMLDYTGYCSPKFKSRNEPGSSTQRLRLPAFARVPSSGHHQKVRIKLRKGSRTSKHFDV